MDRVDLQPEEIPKSWYNILPDLPKKIPAFKDPVEGPSRVKNLRKLFTKAAMDLEFSDER